MKNMKKIILSAALLSIASATFAQEESNTTNQRIENSKARFEKRVENHQERHKNRIEARQKRYENASPEERKIMDERREKWQNASLEERKEMRENFKKEHQERRKMRRENFNANQQHSDTPPPHHRNFEHKNLNNLEENSKEMQEGETKVRKRFLMKKGATKLEKSE